MKGKKDPKEKNIITKKVGRSLKEVVPPSTKNPRENIQCKPPEMFIREYSCGTEPYELFPEWPTEDEINNFDFGSDKNFKFRDNFKYNLPHSIVNEAYNEIKWLSPDQFIKEHYLEEKLKKAYPNKNIIKLRSQIKQYYEKSKASNSSNNLTLTEINSITTQNNMLNEKFEEEEGFEESKLYSYKPFFQILNSKLDLKIIESFEREETDQEFKKRKDDLEIAEKLKLEALKKDKKLLPKTVPKKENKEEIKEERLKIMMAIPSDINMGDPKYPRFSIWLSSQLQNIKDLNITDSISGQTIWEKIYPQKNGIPVYNPCSRYWVKLYHMGKYRKIEVDDLIPCSRYDELLVPKSQNYEELWPVIISKAILKLYSYKFKSTNKSMYEEVGDISIIHCLTGYIGEKLSFQNKDFFPLFKNILNDYFYQNKQKFLLAYNPTQEKYPTPAVSPIKLLKNEPEYLNNIPLLDEKKPDSQIFKKIIRRNTLFDFNKRLGFNAEELLKDQKSNTNQLNDSKDKRKSLKNDRLFNSTTKIKQIDNKNKNNDIFQNIFSNYAYSVVETFYNDTFNMKRTKPLDFSDLKMKVQQAKVSYKQLTKEEKKLYIQNLMELKSKQKEEKNKRIEELKMPGDKIFLLKIKNDSLNSPKINFSLPYSYDEIEMAKKCLFYKWDFPPVNFFEQNNNRLSKSQFPQLYEDFILSAPTKANNSFWNKELYLQITASIDYTNHHETNPLQRGSGEWINLEDFKSLFKEFIVLHNPKFYRSNLKLDNNWYNYNADSFEINPEYQVFHLNVPSHNDNQLKYHNNKITKEYSCFLMLFEPNIDKNLLLNDINLYIIFDLIEYNGEVIYENLHLTSFHSTIQIDTLDPNKEYFILIKSFLTPLGYHLSLYSDHLIDNMSYNNYLKKFRNYANYTFKIDHSALEKNKYFLMMRTALTITKITKLNYSLKYPDKNFKQYLEIMLVNKATKKRIFNYEYITLDPSNYPYYILMQIIPPHNCNEGVIEIDFYSDLHGLNFELITHIDPYEVFDKYTPNKHGIIFKELIYAADTVYSTLYVKLRKENIIKLQNTVIDPKKKEHNPQTSFLIETIEIQDKIRIYLELYKENTLLFQTDAFNNYLMLNQTFEGIQIPQPDPKSKIQTVQNGPINIPYLLICRLDLSEAPTWLLKTDTCKEVGWIIRVISSDTLGFLKDTSKEDSEKALKDSWEISEQGRADKAKKARKKHLITILKEKGETLTEEQEKLLKEIRERKLTTNITSHLVEETKKIDTKAKGNSKVDLKKKEIIQAVVVQPAVNLLDMNKPNPKIEDHSSRYIKDFLEYCYEDRTKIQNNELVNKNIMSNEIKEQIIEKNIKLFEENEKVRSKELEDYNLRKNGIMESLKTLLKETIVYRREIKSEKEDLIKERDLLKSKQNFHKEMEKKLSDITLDIYDFSRAIQIYKEVKGNNFEHELLEKAYNHICSKKEEQYRNDLKKFTPKDKQNALKILDEIKTNGLKINEDILKKLSEISGV